jgi:hypothetical protein
MKAAGSRRRAPRPLARSGEEGRNVNETSSGTASERARTDCWTESRRFDFFTLPKTNMTRGKCSFGA